MTKAKHSDGETPVPTLGRPPIFKELRLRNFKSISDAAIPLHNLTVIVGANSSGKSTVLQALLVLAQAARAGVASGRLPLNGEYVRLGEYQEVQTFGADPATGIKLGLTGQVSIDNPRVRPGLKDAPANQAALSWDGYFASPKNPAHGHAQLQAVEMSMLRIGGEQVFTLDVSSVGEDSFDSADSVEESPLKSNLSQYLQVDGRARSYDPVESVTINRARFVGGLPLQMSGDDNRFTQMAREWWQIWEDHNREELEILKAQERRQVGAFAKRIPEKKRLAAVDRLEKLVRNHELTYQFSAIPGMRDVVSPNMAFYPDDYFRSDLEKTKQKARNDILLSMVALREKAFTDELLHRLSKIGGTSQESLNEIHGRLGDRIRESSAYFRGYLGSLKYLGPIREAPRALYDPSPDRDDIGVRGEFAAAVLNAEARRPVRCPLPGGGEKRLPLGSALNLWLSEFGLAERAEAKDLGRLGMSLTVSPRTGAPMIDLTSVGVGVSQVLPVILLCLKSMPNAVILLEQPELHLHPAMQLKLADFLLACTQTGRQIIVETHSEHFVNRLRRRVAEDQTASLHEHIGLLFAEQSNGASHYQPTTINRRGGLSGDWPSGFLNVGADEASEFLLGAVRRNQQSVDLDGPQS